MQKKIGFLIMSLFVAASASAMPAHPTDVIKVFAKSAALRELLDDHEDFTGLTITVMSHVSDAVESLCNQKSRSRSIVSVSLSKGTRSNEYYFQTAESPSHLARCLPGDQDGL